MHQWRPRVTTRNTHAHLCLTPGRRLRARVKKCGAGTIGEARVARVTFANLIAVEAVWCCSIQAAMAPRPRPPSPSPKNAEQYLSRAYLNVSDCVTHIWPNKGAIGKWREKGREGKECTQPTIYNLLSCCLHVYSIQLTIKLSRSLRYVVSHVHAPAACPPQRSEVRDRAS